MATLPAVPALHDDDVSMSAQPGLPPGFQGTPLPQDDGLDEVLSAPLAINDEVPAEIAAAWDALQGKNGTQPSTRAIATYLRERGTGVGNTRLTHALKTLRRRAAAPTPEADASAAAQGLAVAAPRVALAVTPTQYAALQAAKQFLQDNPRWYDKLRLTLAHHQPQREGALTALLATLVGHE